MSSTSAEGVWEANKHAGRSLHIFRGIKGHSWGKVFLLNRKEGDVFVVEEEERYGAWDMCKQLRQMARWSNERVSQISWF